MIRRTFDNDDKWQTIHSAIIRSLECERKKKKKKMKFVKDCGASDTLFEFRPID